MAAANLHPDGRQGPHPDGRQGLHPDERRANPRAPIRTSVDFFTDGRLEVGESLDIGGGGMLLAAAAQLEVGSEVRVRFTPPEAPRSLLLGGRVARCATSEAGAPAFGIQFLDPLPDAVDHLDRLAREFIDRMRSLEPPAPAPAPEVEPEPAPEDDTLYFTLTFETADEFLDAYEEHLAALRVLVANPEPLSPGHPIVIELELPDDLDPIALAAEVADDAWAGSWSQEGLTVVRLSEPESAEMGFVHDLARAYLGFGSGEEAPAQSASSDDDTVADIVIEEDEGTDGFGRGYESEFSLDDFEDDGTPLEIADEDDGLDGAISRALSVTGEDDLLTETERQSETEREIENAFRRSTRPARRSAKPDENAAREGRYFGDALVADLMADEELSGEGPGFGASAPAGRSDERPRASEAARRPRDLDDDEIGRLRADLASDDAQLRREALWTLGEARNAPAEVVPALVEALDDDDARVRWRAVRALRGMGPAARDAGAALEARLDDPDPGVRFMIAEALSRLTG